MLHPYYNIIFAVKNLRSFFIWLIVKQENFLRIKIQHVLDKEF